MAVRSTSAFSQYRRFGSKNTTGSSEAMAARKEPLLAVEAAGRPREGVMVDDGTAVDDDLLRLVLMCAHPALAPEAASALSLRLVMGLPTADIARLFLVPETTMAARITRAKKKVVAAGIPIITALIGLGTGLLGVVGATAFFDIGSSTPMLASMIGLAVGIDYALFILARYRS